MLLKAPYSSKEIHNGDEEFQEMRGIVEIGNTLDMEGLLSTVLYAISPELFKQSTEISLSMLEINKPFPSPCHGVWFSDCCNR